MKAFISYSVEDKVWGGRFKKFFDRCGVPSFLAHDDLQVSDEWKQRIYAELKASDTFVCLLSQNSKNSDWCSQEIGIAYGREDVAFIPISLDGSVSYGFIFHLQSTVIREKSEIEEFVAGGLLRRNLLKGVELSIALTRSARHFRGAEAVVKRIVPYFDQMEAAHAEAFAEASAKNYQVWDAGDCRVDYLPQFLEANREKITDLAFRRLDYQIKNSAWYREEAEQERGELQNGPRGRVPF